ncbi:(2Fe-2S)-binding protein [Aurantimonas endophytica]|uniref:Carbon-monoxide dehydrogenase small subunit n=1 Tax=Aurantimonas endophytica TaxID=1522175 RepID=A0A7W6HGM5_9HYPH|nr:(2Fe-2S)-binding protein [Aurantimonas endophytica]MBB4004807.1 carbon-monoxide dehydrogenase small subunit [Aurantimonas endophytica]MCO6405617.1 2Fe-2S iron-sulfur cluster binding domain-containing protein [Aurantimonas endophytica]
MSVSASFQQHVSVRLTVNGETVHRDVEARRHLVDFLRLDLGLTGSHAGCEQGVCGACTLRVNGDIVRGCLMLVAQLDGAEVWTVEGLSETGEIRDLQDEFIRRNALQCGFCTPGMLLTAAELLDRPDELGREEIREHLSGNYCRCTGYEAIVDAVASTMAARRESADLEASR